MTLDQIIAAEELSLRAMRAIRSFVEKGADRDALDRAAHIVKESRHFAVSWDDIRNMEDKGELDAIAAREARQNAINRLVTSVAPSRL